MGQTRHGAGLAAWPGRRLERQALSGKTDRGAGRGDEAMKLECGMEAGSPMGLDVKRCGVGLRPTI